MKNFWGKMYLNVAKNEQTTQALSSFKEINYSNLIHIN